MYRVLNFLRFQCKIDRIKKNHDTKSPMEPELFVMDELEAFDIDYDWQFDIGEVLYERFK